MPAPPNGTIPDSPLNAVDTLLGFSTDLWPIIHRLSHLLSFKNQLEAAITAGRSNEATVLRTELENSSLAIELALTNWQPTLSSVPPDPFCLEKDMTNSNKESSNQDPANDTRIQSILNNAEAYRHSAFVYLYRTIRSLPRPHTLAQKHVRLSLQACSNVVTLAEKCQDGPMSALLWPIFVAACEAISDEDRELATEGFGGIEKRQGMNNIGRAWEIVREVWRRVDESEDGEGEVDWREICAERGVSIVFG
jgi:Fungal specific transcription factor domain